MDFKDKVKYVRKALNISQEELARELGVSFATINRWESGKSLPSYDKIKLFNDFCLNKNLKEIN